MKRKILAFLMLFGLCFSPFGSDAQNDYAPPGGNTNGYAYGVKGIRLFDGETEIIYNDDIQGGQTKKPCGRKFFFATYTNEPTEFKIIAELNNTYNDFTVTVKENGVITQTITDVDQDEPFQLTFQTSGTKEIFFNNYKPIYQNAYPSINMKTIIEVIPKVEKVWIETPEICTNNWPAGQDIPVELKTYPAFNTLYHWADKHERWNSVNCAAADNLGFSFVHSNVVNVQSIVNGYYSCNQYNPSIPYDVSGYIAYSDAAPYIANGESIPLSFTYYDGITTRVLNHRIKTTGPMSSFPPYTNDWYDEWSINIYGNAVWTATDNPSKNTYSISKNKLRINKELHIHKGASLSVSDMTIEFGPEGKIILEADANTSDYGSLLVLTNTKLTAYRDCGNEGNMWEGVIVKGNASKGQYAIAPNGNGVDRYQGMLVMSSSEISYAREAVRLWSADDPNIGIAGNGGIVVANNSRFYNNRRSAEFMKYSYTDPNNPNMIYNNASHFKKCTFEVDGNYPGTDFWGFISGWAVRGLGIAGCSFKNSGYTGGPSRGIYGEDLGVSVGKSSVTNGTRSSFENLTVAVENKYIGGPASLSVNKAIFEDNVNAVVSGGLMAPSIKDNEIYHPYRAVIPPYTVTAPHGVMINTGSGYRITGNTVSGNSLLGVGVVVINSGSDPNTVERNTFYNMRTGGLSNYKNRSASSQNKDGLQFRCNIHDAVNFDIAARGGNSTSDGMAAEQGSNAVPAGNQFNSGSSANIYNPSNEVGGVNYYYYINGSNTTPNNNVGNVTPIGINAENFCQEANDAGQTGGFSGNPPKIYNGFMRVINDSTGINKDSLYYWVNQWRSPYGSLLKTDLLLEDGQVDEANAVYNSITRQYVMDNAENIEFAQYGRMLINLRAALVAEGKTMKQLSADQVATLETVAQRAKLWAKVRAQNWLTLYDGRQFEQHILYPEGRSNAARRALPEEAASVSAADAVYPNPVGETLQVYYTTGSDADLRIELLDLLGRKVLSVPLSKGLNSVQTSQLKAGVYYYKVLEGNEVKLKGKLIKK